MIEIVDAADTDQLNAIRDFVHQFVHWHRQLHDEDKAFTDEYFNAAAIEEELAALPGKYAAPDGRLLLAYYKSQPAGCVALREKNTQTCEMKRMFVNQSFQGKGIGSALAKAIIAEAKTIGYKKMRLDTSKKQTGALRLYERMGFKRTDADYAMTERLEKWLVFMELEL